MSTKTPAVAIRRREAALGTFRTKLDVLERLVTDDTLDRFPERASVSAFASWRDEALGVAALSRSASPSGLSMSGGSSVTDSDIEYIVQTTANAQIAASV